MHPASKSWLTEFGWDSTTKPQAKEGDFKKWVGVTDLQQAQYLVRAFLILSELDLDRAYIFWFNDEDVASVHASSGLTRHYQFKPSFHAIAHLLAGLGDYRFGRIVTKKPGELYVFEFRHGANPDRAIWAAWSPSGTGRKANVRIPIGSATIERAERMPISNSPDPVRWTTHDSGEIELEINESPVYLWLKL